VGRDFPHLSRPAPGRDADHKPLASVEVKKELSYTSTHPMGPPGPVTGFPLFYLSFNVGQDSVAGRYGLVTVRYAALVPGANQPRVRWVPSHHKPSRQYFRLNTLRRSVATIN
jgi:hypothetical protein